MPVSKLRKGRAVHVPQIGQQDRMRLLDKMHVQKMARAMHGVVVALAFDDAQGQRAACYHAGVTAWQLGTTKEALLERVAQAYDIVKEDLDATSGEPPARETSKLVMQ